jgi:hypothetical protein
VREAWDCSRGTWDSRNTLTMSEMHTSWITRLLLCAVTPCFGSPVVYLEPASPRCIPPSNRMCTALRAGHYIVFHVSLQVHHFFRKTHPPNNGMSERADSVVISDHPPDSPGLNWLAIKRGIR